MSATNHIITPNDHLGQLSPKFDAITLTTRLAIVTAALVILSAANEVGEL
jgi:hypothetical protein